MTNATRCFAGTTETCVISYGDAGFQFYVPDHVAETSPTISIAAVQKASGSSSCSSAFSTSKAIKFTCSYQNPATGTLPVRIASLPLNAANSNSAACDSTGKTMNVSFNASGVGSTTLQYADVGHMNLTASYTGSAATGDAGLVMTGSDNFITAPASFGFSAISATPIQSGSPFSTTVTAFNSAGNATPNFGKESTPENVTLTHQLVSPTGTGAFVGTLSPGTFGNFSAGSASNSTISFSEVGVIKLIGTLTSGNYLVSGFNANGTSANIGNFIPHHFDTATSEGCNSFTYSGQPFSAVVLAKNASGITTQNYDGSTNTTPNFANLVTLSEGGTSLGSFNPATVVLTNFNAGVATITPAFTYTNLNSPTQIIFRASDVNASSSGFTEGQIYAYSGRVNLQNAFGSELVNLPVPMTVEYYDGKNFITHTNDSCSIATLSIVNSGASDSLQPTDSCIWDDSSQSGSSRCSAIAPAGSSYQEAGSLVNGNFNLNLKAPAKTGSLKLQASVDSWLQFNWQGTGNTNPSALVNFGLYKGNSKIIYFREVY
jgi:MSHA biogenesis protein MshQ